MAKRGERSAERIPVECPCGTVFEVTRNRYESGRGRRCSKKCQYRYATRPKGLTYNITKENPTVFKSGQTPWNAGTRGVMIAWNKGIKTGVVPPNAFKSRETIGPANSNWKGDRVGYGALHAWVERNKTRTGRCADCGTEGPTDWANISYEYRRDVSDWRELCHKCHLSGDSTAGEWGTAKRIFPGYGKRRD